MISSVLNRSVNAMMVLIALIGCDNSPAVGSSDDSSNGGSYMDVSEAFAKAIHAGDYPAAYALTSSHIRGRMTAEEFAKFHADALTKYGKPRKYEVSVGNDDREEIRGEEWDDTGIPAKDRLVWMHVLWVLEVDDAGEIERSYETWMMIVKEDGEFKIGSIEYTWPD